MFALLDKASHDAGNIRGLNLAAARQGYSCESQVITVCQDITDSLDNGGKIDASIIGFPKAFDLVPRDRPLIKIAASGVDSRVVPWIREFLLGHTQTVRVGG
jgi:hypothetical protein